MHGHRVDFEAALLDRAIFMHASTFQHSKFKLATMSGTRFEIEVDLRCADFRRRAMSQVTNNECPLEPVIEPRYGRMNVMCSYARFACVRSDAKYDSLTTWPCPEFDPTKTGQSDASGQTCWGQRQCDSGTTKAG